MPTTENTSMGLRSGRGGLKSDMGRLRNLLNGSKKTEPTWLNKPDRQMPPLEQTTPRSLALNSSIDTSFDEGSLDLDHPTKMNDESSNMQKNQGNFDPVHEMMNLFSPSPKNASTNFEEHKTSTAEKPTAQNDKVSYDYDTNMRSSDESTFDPFRDIRKILTPKSSRNDTNALPMESNEEEESSRQLDCDFQPHHFQQQISNFFSPSKNETNAPQAETSKTPDRLLQAFYPLNIQGTPKRSKHEPEDDGVSNTTSNAKASGREMLKFSDLCRNTRSRMVQLAAAAKERSASEWLRLIRDFDVKGLASDTQHNAKRSLQKLLDSTKQIDPLVLLENAKVSAQEVMEAVRTNAHARPLPWAVIGAVTCVILVHALFFNQSLGTPSNHNWQFTMNVHESVPLHASRHIVERVGEAFQTQIGEQGEEALAQIRSTLTYPTSSGEEMLLRISQKMAKLEPKPDILDLLQNQMARIRQNPRVLLEMLADAWNTGRQHLASDAFDATAL